MIIPITIKNNHLHIFFISSVLLSYSIPLVNLFTSQIVCDWNYFNALNLVIRSSVLEYEIFPHHDPWVSGGVDLWANPQTRIFTPFLITDVLLLPHISNLLSLIIWGILGVYGCYRLLTYLGVEKLIAAILSVVYINSSWFTLHYTEGHITYGTFQLLAYIFYLVLRFDNARYICYFILLQALFVLTGAFYTFIYSIYIFIFFQLFSINGIGLKVFYKTVINNWKPIALTFITFWLLSAIKLIPLLTIAPHSTGYYDLIRMPLRFIFTSYLNPFHHKNINVWEYGDLRWGFQEFGTYFSVLGLILISINLFSKYTLLQTWKYLVIALLFFIISIGWFEPINPYRLMNALPFFSIAHVNSRFILIVFIIFIILLGFTLSKFYTLIPPKYIFIILSLLFLESIITGNYSFYESFYKSKQIVPASSFSNLITSTTIEKTEYSYVKPDGYYNTNIAYWHTYEPFQIRAASIRHLGDTITN
ncbi:MAG: hypothetical protein SNJ71_08080, partial [Bacteroidales bacterium]